MDTTWPDCTFAPGPTARSARRSRLTAVTARASLHSSRPEASAKAHGCAGPCNQASCPRRSLRGWSARPAWRGRANTWSSTLGRADSLDADPEQQVEGRAMLLLTGAAHRLVGYPQLSALVNSRRGPGR